MRRLSRKSAVVLGVALTAAQPALAQDAPAPPAPPPVPGSAADPTGLGAINVTAKRLDEARTSIQPSLGASTYDFSRSAIQAIPQGDNAALNSVLLRAPGVAQDSFGQLHVRGDHANLQYRLDGVQLPEGLSLFGQALETRFADSLSLMTGALPAQYGFRTAGVVDMQLKSGTTDPGGEVGFMGGSRDTLQPSFAYGGRTGKVDYFFTGDFLHNGIGIENPTSSFNPLHDDSDQWHGLAKITAIVDDQTRLSFIGGYAKANFQIPNNPGQVPGFTVNGSSNFNSANLDQRQWEQTAFGIVSLQKHYDTVDFQLSAFTRSSILSYSPDGSNGDLMFNGIQQTAARWSLATGIQADGSWKVNDKHTLRGGFLVQREHAQANTSSSVLPVDDMGTPISDQPFNISSGSDLIGWQYGIYIQDEWHLSDTLTMNVGARFDVLNALTQENQLSPRINFVYQPNDILTAHIGYARYFTPPPLEQVSFAAVAAFNGSTAASEVLVNNPVKAERSHYFDGGFTLKPLPGLSFGVDAYYKIATNLIDEGQFGAPIILTPFNYANANVKGIELSASYDRGPWSIYGNIAWSQAKGTNINSAQFNFAAADLAYIAQNYIYLDHDQQWTGSAGAAYTFNYGSDWATRVSADFLLGSGLRADDAVNNVPNGLALPGYTSLNLSLIQKLPIGRGAEARIDVINLFDNSYMIRDGTGVGVGAPQFGLRRAVMVGLKQKF
jgi:outer membrane receptor protein involved in Fe transport